MTQVSKIPKTTFLFFVLISIYILLASVDKTIDTSGYYASMILPLLLAVLLAVLIILAVRTTIVAWTTVVVLLAFAGKRRRVLAEMRSEITSEASLYFVKVVIQDKGLVAFSSATIISLTMMAWLRIADQTSLEVGKL